MGNKCKICGYRFKSRDEEICPECFTARDDDISCDRYSGKDHTHRKTTYAGDFMETGESFVQKELRKERNNAFARENFGTRANAGLDLSRSAPTYDRSRFERDDYNYDFSKEYHQIMSQSYPAQPQPKAQPQQTAYQRFSAQQQHRTTTTATTSGFTPAGQAFVQRANAQMQYNRNRKKSNPAVAIVFLMAFVAMFVIGVISSRNAENNSNRRTTVYTTKQTTTRRTTTATTTKTKRTTTQGYTSKIENESKAVNSSLGHYSAKITDAVFEKKDKADIDKRLLGSSNNNTNDEEPWEIVTLNIELSATDKPPADPSKTSISTSTMQCLEKETANNTMSYSVWAINEDIDLSGGKVNTTVTLLAHKDAKLIYFNIYLKNSGVTETCRFKITRD